MHLEFSGVNAYIWHLSFIKQSVKIHLMPLEMQFLFPLQWKDAHSNVNIKICKNKSLHCSQREIWTLMTTGLHCPKSLWYNFFVCFFTWSTCCLFPLFCCQSAPELFIYVFNSQNKLFWGGCPQTPLHGLYSQLCHLFDLLWVCSLSIQ